MKWTSELRDRQKEFFINLDVIFNFETSSTLAECYVIHLASDR